MLVNKKLVQLCAFERQSRNSISFISDTWFFKAKTSMIIPTLFPACLQFTAVQYNTLVESERERTFEYSFTPSDQFPARPFGLTINLNYRDNVSIRRSESWFASPCLALRPREKIRHKKYFDVMKTLRYFDTHWSWCWHQWFQNRGVDTTPLG